MVAWTNYGGRFSLEEEEDVELVCEAVGGYPEPQFAVEGPESLESGKQVLLYRETNKTDDLFIKKNRCQSRTNVFELEKDYTTEMRHSH